MYITERGFQIPHHTNDLKDSIGYLTNTFEKIENDLNNIFITELITEDGTNSVPLRKNTQVQEIQINNTPIDTLDYSVNYETKIISFKQNISLKINDKIDIYYNIVSNGTFDEFMNSFAKIPNWSNYEYEFNGIVFYNDDGVTTKDDFIQYYKEKYPLDDDIEVRNDIIIPPNTEAYAFGNVVLLGGANITLSDNATLISYYEQGE